jgi:murein L,D-transpeptidase YafK
VSDAQSRRTVLSALFLGLVGSFTPRATRAEALKADKVVILKSRRLLLLMRDGKPFATFRVALGSHPVGPKESAGDGRTPEGFYHVDGRNRRSPYHLSLHLSYPNEIDRISSDDRGETTGGDIAIHGMPAQFGRTDPIGYFKDWTDGCISVGNVAIEKIWAAVDDGTPVEIRP